MNDSRLKLTENDNLINTARGAETDCLKFDMREKSIDSIIEKEKANQFNNQVDAYVEDLNKKHLEVEETASNLGYDINRAEIKPMFARLLVKPFKQNPFQRMKVQGGLIVDAGGYTPHTQLNPNTGKYEEQKEFIVTGCVIEVGPDTKYLREGDVIYYRIDTTVPVPFFKEGLVSLNENQVIAVVNEGLEERFKEIK